MGQLDRFFAPQSIAVVGASRTDGKAGREVLRNILHGGYAGKVFPVNPYAEEIAGLRCFPNLRAIGEVPDLVIIVVPAAEVQSIMRQCAVVGARAIIIITAGFKETGADGARLERTITQIARQTGIRVLGPNCLGIVVPAMHLNASFGGDMPDAGTIGYLSQSGAQLAAVLDMANAHHMGFSKLISIGNKADVDELDTLRALGDDPDTRVIVGYLESITDGNLFVHEAEHTSQEKPIILMKSGGTVAGSRAASSHTGSMTGSEIAYECMFERAGIIRCDSIREQFDYARAFAMQPLPKGDRVAVVTNAGGLGIMAADAIERQELTFAELSEETIRRLEEKLPAIANTRNPIDVLGDALADRYEFAMRAVLDDPNVDMVLAILTPQVMTKCAEIAEAVARVAREKTEKPILACFMGALKMQEAIGILEQEHIPQYDSPESAVQTMKVMTEYVRWRARPKRVVKLFPVNRHRAEAIIERHLRLGIREIGEMEAKEILEAYGFVTPKGMIATTAEQAAGFAEQLGFPVVLKVWSPAIIHKTDVDGVKLNLRTPEEVVDAFDLMMYRIPKRLPESNILGVLVQEMCDQGLEVILGMHRDPRFGPVMMFGMGGAMVDVLKDVSFYLAPLTAEEARQMLINTRTYHLLQGARGRQGVDIDAVAEALQRLSQLVTEFPQIQELDINPFIVGPRGTVPVAVDARISVQGQGNRGA